MEILRFTLSGKNAFFKKPDVNTYNYFTYGNIHKVALLGIFGAILGYHGYIQYNENSSKRKKGDLEASYPEFYQKLKDLKISILPKKNKGYIQKKIQAFNNSVGYASKELGGNLIVREQWLEKPEWDICVLIDSGEAMKIRDAICAHRCIFYPYLGKNDHMADIQNISVENAVQCVFDLGRLDCLAPKENVFVAELDYEEMEDLDLFETFHYMEDLPVGLNPFTNLYQTETFIYTDGAVKVKNADVYQLSDQKNIIFY